MLLRKYLFFPVIITLSVFASSHCQAQAKAYFQQRVDTRLEVRLDDTAHMLQGYEELDYYNHSPDTLFFIYFHLWPNAYKNDHTAYVKQAVDNFSSDFYFAKHKYRGYMDSLAFEVEGRKAGMVLTNDADIVKLMLPQPLAPGEKITITTPFSVKLPLTFSRLGYVGQSYQISQWFPKPAVYDAKGWHPMPYLDQGEFYSEYGSYDVKITLPKNYVVMATGNLQDVQEQEWLNSLSQQVLPPDTLFKNNFPASSSEIKTLHYKEDNIHDFAWFADKRWVVRKDTVAVPGTSGMVTAWTAFLPKDQKGWSEGTASLKQTVIALSNQVGPYPYQTIKAVEGNLEAGGGMEYPTVTVIAPSNDIATNHTVIVHEAGHNWFYGMLGSNERIHSWMDEGINSFYEKEITDQPRLGSKMTDTNADVKSGSMKVKNGSLSLSLNEAFSKLGFTYPMSVRTDMASGWRADTFTNLAYGGDVYGKTPYLLRWLRDYMGKTDFEAAMKDYFAQWQFKHPYPEDFEKIFKAHTSKDISWFFSLLNSDEPVDFAIKKISTPGALQVSVRNKGKIAAPVKVNMIQHEGNEPSFVMSEPFTGTTTLDFEVTDYYKRLWIDDNIPDYVERNNSSKKSFRLKPFLGLNTGPYSRAWIAPALGYNYYDGFMLGAVIHNITVPQNKFQYILAPMFAFGSSTIAGTGRIGYTSYFRRSSWLHNLQWNLEGKTFSYMKSDLNISDPIAARYLKVAPELIFTLKKPFARASVENRISLKGYWISEEVLSFNQDPVDSLYRPSKAGMNNQVYARLRYDHENYRMFNPFSYRFEAQAGEKFAKLSAEAQMKIDYFSKGKGLYVRGFGGKFFNFASNEFETSRYWFATTYTGVNDYLYDGTYIGRNEASGFAGQQVGMKEGGFAYRSSMYARPLGLSGNWLFALNVKTDLPLGRIPLRLYANISSFSDAQLINPSGAKGLFETGVELYIGKYVSVFFPVFVSKDYSEYATSVLGKNAYLKSISFSLNIENIDWFNLPKQMLRKM